MDHAYARGALLRFSSATRLRRSRFEAKSIAINWDSYPKGHIGVDLQRTRKRTISRNSAIWPGTLVYLVIYPTLPSIPAISEEKRIRDKKILYREAFYSQPVCIWLISELCVDDSTYYITRQSQPRRHLIFPIFAHCFCMLQGLHIGVLSELAILSSSLLSSSQLLAE
jgi:hypothetical protein